MSPKSENRYPALERVKADVEAGDLGKAKERLTGLLHAHPDDLALRPKLAEVYWLMKWPEEAGAYWYLEPDPTEDMQKAIALFEHRCKHDPLRIFERLKLRINFEEMPEGYAKDKVLRLKDTICSGGRLMPPNLEARLRTDRSRPIKGKSSCEPFGVGCTIAFIIAVTLMLIGVATVGEWILGK